MFHLHIHFILTFMKETKVKSRFSDIKFSDNLQFSAIYFAEYNFSIYIYLLTLWDRVTIFGDQKSHQITAVIR